MHRDNGRLSSIKNEVDLYMLLWKDLLTSNEKSKVQGAAYSTGSRNGQKRRFSLHVPFLPPQSLFFRSFLEMPVPPQKLTGGPLWGDKAGVVVGALIFSPSYLSFYMCTFSLLLLFKSRSSYLHGQNPNSVSLFMFFCIKYKTKKVF